MAEDELQFVLQNPSLVEDDPTFFCRRWCFYPSFQTDFHVLPSPIFGGGLWQGGTGTQGGLTALFIILKVIKSIKAKQQHWHKKTYTSPRTFPHLTFWKAPSADSMILPLYNYQVEKSSTLIGRQTLCWSKQSNF